MTILITLKIISCFFLVVYGTVPTLLPWFQDMQMLQKFGYATAVLCPSEVSPVFSLWCLYKSIHYCW
jgi:hypothetical protein